jgi:hypothetical protein
VAVPAAAYDYPTVQIAAPENGAQYLVGETVTASYSCADPNPGGGGIRTLNCTGTVGNGQAIDTGSLGDKRFTVHAQLKVDQGGTIVTTNSELTNTYSVLPSNTVFLGSDLKGSPDTSCGASSGTGCTLAALGTSASSPTIVAPESGYVTSFSIKHGPWTGTAPGVALYVLHPVGRDIAGEEQLCVAQAGAISPLSHPEGGVDAYYFLTSGGVPIEAGDRVGVFVNSPTLALMDSTGTAPTGEFGGDAGQGWNEGKVADHPFKPVSAELSVRAIMEKRPATSSCPRSGGGSRITTTTFGFQPLLSQPRSTLITAVNAASRQTVRADKRGRVVLSAIFSCGVGPCSWTALATATGARARAVVGARKKRRKVTIGSAMGQLTQGRVLTASFVLTRQARRALERRRKLTATVALAVREPTGLRRAAHVTLTIKAPKRNHRKGR